MPLTQRHWQAHYVHSAPYNELNQGTSCTHLAMFVIQVESTPCIINRAVLASLDAETQLCLRQMAQRPRLCLLTLAH